MKLTLISLSHRIEDWAQQATQQYATRLPKDWKLHIKELKPEARTRGLSKAQILKTESDKILQAKPRDALLIGLDEKGQSLTSVALANQLETWHNQSQEVCLVIGSADGLCLTLKEQCHALWRLSDLTLPHALARVVLVEALYRAWSITANHPYHRL